MLPHRYNQLFCNSVVEQTRLDEKYLTRSLRAMRQGCWRREKLPTHRFGPTGPRAHPNMVDANGATKYAYKAGNRFWIEVRA
jgi:hypothetical protein